MKIEVFFMFREFERDMEKKTPKVLFINLSLKPKKLENNIQGNLLTMKDKRIHFS